MNDATLAPRISRAQAKAETRQRLLTAAREVFSTVGYQGATLDGIAAKAGCTKGAFYWHFPNKQALFLALVADSIRDNLQMLDQLILHGEAEPAQVKTVMSQWIEEIDSRETLPAYGVELEIEARRDTSFRALHQQLIGRHEAALTAFLQRYFEAVGEAPCMPVDQLASTLITLFKGFALVRQNRDDLPVSSAKAVRILLNIPLPA